MYKMFGPIVRIAANGYRLCDPLPKGQTLIDSTNKEWILGSTIGSGGFGDIYSCRRKGEAKDVFVIKLDNIDGPLFAEMNFYLRVAKEEAINAFISDRRLRFLGMPAFIANGIHDKTSAQTNKLNKQTAVKNSQTKGKSGPTLQYRFLVIQRFGEELEKYVKSRRLSASDAADIAAKMIDVLEYIHSFGYIHADIKPTNILKSLSKSKTSNEWYLVDYGLAERFRGTDGQHREEKADKKRANNGTVEFRSRDAHIGQISRRSDIECLAYNLIQWLYGTLPWMTFLSNANKVEESKRQLMANIDKLLPKCFKKSVPNGLKDFLREVNKIGFNSEPNYKLLKQILSTKVAKSVSNVEDSDEEESDVEDDDEEEEESDNSPKRRRNVSKTRTTKPKPKPKAKTRTKKRANDRDVIELSDSDDDCVQSVVKIPPKRSRTQNIVNKVLNIENNKRLNIKTTPKVKGKAKPLPRFSTPLLFATEDEESDMTATDISVGQRSSGRLRASNGSASDVELCRADGETPAMRAIRAQIERKKLEKQMKNKKKK